MPIVKAIVVGAGGMARWHIRSMLGMKRATAVVGLVEPSAGQREKTRAVFAEHKRPCPPFYMTIRELLEAQGPADAALVCTPHKFHYADVRDCLLAGMDVCVEKPMVMNAAEAQGVIRLRDRTRRLVLVAFPGSLSPAVWKAKDLIRKGAIGKVSMISAYAQQHWRQGTTNTWRQMPKISGGGFLFDTGSHMVNTVVDLIGEDVARVAALLDNCGAPVEINSSVSGISKSGIMFSLTGAGESVHCCSQVTAFGDGGALRTGIWGENLSIQTAKSRDFVPVAYRKSKGPWEQFLRVRRGAMKNPCPPEVGLRFARLMDMIRRSAATGRTVRAR